MHNINLKYKEFITEICSFALSLFEIIYEKIPTF
jgi:hypothetical protein